jgi:hypothetical protein
MRARVRPVGGAFHDYWIKIDSGAGAAAPLHADAITACPGVVTD